MHPQVCETPTLFLQGSVSAFASFELCTWIVSLSFRACAFSTNIFFILHPVLLIKLEACFSQDLNSAVTLVCSAWRNLLGSTTIFSSMFLRVLMMILSSTDYALRDPSDKATFRRSTTLTSSVIWLVRGARLICAFLAWPVPTCILLVWISSLRRTFWTFPSDYLYCCSNFCNSSNVAYHTLSLISLRSPSVKVMGSAYVSTDFFFLQEPSFFFSLCFLSWNGVFFPSSPPPPC